MSRADRPPAPLTLVAILQRTGIRLVAALVGAALVVVVAMATVPELRDDGLDARGAASPATDRVGRLISGHDCWTGTAPQGVIPGHAVVTSPGHRARLVDAGVGFAIWLDGAPGVLHAFCP